MAKSKDDSAGSVTGAMVAQPLERLTRLLRAGEHSQGLNPAQWEALRYLARANRFSNAPGALTRYLGSTKGTISQTVKALVGKGLVSKVARRGEKRSVALLLTGKGKEVLALDPWARLTSSAEALGGKTRRRMARGLSEILASEIQLAGLPAFGTCAGCRFFREKGRDGDPRGPHYCMLFDEPIAIAETQLICVGHEARG